jgi:hypothetical protein
MISLLPHLKLYSRRSHQSIQTGITQAVGDDTCTRVWAPQERAGPGSWHVDTHVGPRATDHFQSDCQQFAYINLELAMINDRPRAVLCLGNTTPSRPCDQAPTAGSSIMIVHESARTRA